MQVIVHMLNAQQVGLPKIIFVRFVFNDNYFPNNKFTVILHIPKDNLITFYQ